MCCQCGASCLPSDQPREKSFQKRKERCCAKPESSRHVSEVLRSAGREEKAAHLRAEEVMRLAVQASICTGIETRAGGSIKSPACLRALGRIQLRRKQAQQS